MDDASLQPQVPSSLADGFNPLMHLSTAFGVPGFLWSALYPQVMGLSKKFPRAWRLLTAAVLAHVVYQYTWDKLVETLKYTLSLAACHIKIYETDELMGCFIRWLDQKNPPFTQESSMTGQSMQYHNIYKDYEDQEVSFRTTSTNVKPANFVLERSYNARVFRHKRRFFWITHTTEQNANWSSRENQVKKGLAIWTLGRSVKPIADVLDDAVDNHSNDGEKLATTLYVPSGSHDSGGWGQGYDARHGGGMWYRRAVKPCRPIDTVYLDGNQRDMITHDVERFLHADTAARYRSKGIPHRRGYLFHGPPGNGKSSLAMALAGHFGLNVYSLSLRDSTLNDNYLASLFNVLPPSKVLVLLEDIDSAGLKREEEFDDISSIDEWAMPNPPRRARPSYRPVNITLSGVLNAIDGIAAPEGHILIMTTNAPEALDKALVRPGRVDVKVEFKNAGQNQLREMFSRMYRDEGTSNTDETVSEKATVRFPTESLLTAEANVTSTAPFSVLPTQPPRLQASELQVLADQFSTAVPAQKCSLAEVQNFLLGRVDDPRRAIDEAPAWAEELMYEKAELEERKKEKAANLAVEQEKIRERAREMRVISTVDGREIDHQYQQFKTGSEGGSPNGHKTAAVGEGIVPVSVLPVEVDLKVNGEKGVKLVNGYKTPPVTADEPKA